MTEDPSPGASRAGLLGDLDDLRPADSGGLLLVMAPQAERLFCLRAAGRVRVTGQGKGRGFNWALGRRSYHCRNACKEGLFWEQNS